MGKDEQYMWMALGEATQARDEGNEPYGAVIVRGDAVVPGRNLVRTTTDPTAHAEVVAIRRAATAWQTNDLSGSVMYASFQPCPMCCGAMLLSGITSVIIGARPRAEERIINQYSFERLVELVGRRSEFNIREDVLTAEFRDFYSSSPR